MTLKPWREAAIPHEDVLKGTFQQADGSWPARRRAAGAPWQLDPRTGRIVTHQPPHAKKLVHITGGGRVPKCRA
jgi:hypothetical protein